MNLNAGATNLLQKVSGCDGCPDAGAVTTQQLTSGDGYVEFTATEQWGLRFIGLSNGNPGTSNVEIKHALRFDGGIAEVRESGIYRSDTPFVNGDTFRIAVTGGIVRYSKNGTIFYTSQVTPLYPMLVDTSFNTLNSTLANIFVSFTGSSSPPAPAPSATVQWTKLVNAVVNNGVLQKNGGCNGCQDAGGVSSQQMSSTAGAFEFIVTETTKERWVGVTNNTNTRRGDQLAFSWRVRNGAAEIREAGKLRATTTLTVGAVLRIAIVNGRIEFSKNGALLYRSGARLPAPLNAHAVLVGAGAEVAAATIR